MSHDRSCILSGNSTTGPEFGPQGDPGWLGSDLFPWTLLEGGGHLGDALSLRAPSLPGESSPLLPSDSY